MKVPSVDRRDDYLPYTIDNILRVCTWQENCDRGNSDRRNGVNNKNSRAVIQKTMDGKFIREFHSIMEAQRVLGIRNGNICSVCRGKDG